MARIGSGMKALLARQGISEEGLAEEEPRQREAKPKPRARQRKPEVDAGLGGGDGVLVGSFPHLDPGVAAAALAAGVSSAALQEMDRLVMGESTAKMPKSRAAPPRTGPLSETEGEDEAGHRKAVTATSPERAVTSTDPVGDAISRLTTAVELLASDKVKKKAVHPLDSLFESGSQDAAAGPSLRRNAAARKALREALTENPALISKTIESLMLEDLLVQTGAPGVPTATSARGWLEFRSRIGPFPGVVKTAWGVAGALDAARLGRFEECKARLYVLLLMIDQAAADRGSYTLASELSLEPPAPLHSFRLHEHRDQEQPFSRLLDARWAEVAIHHLRDQADFMEKRAKLNQPRKGAQSQEEDERREAPKAKAKQKGGRKKQLEE